MIFQQIYFKKNRTRFHQYCLHFTKDITKK